MHFALLKTNLAKSMVKLIDTSPGSLNTPIGSPTLLYALRCVIRSCISYDVLHSRRVVDTGLSKRPYKVGRQSPTQPGSGAVQRGINWIRHVDCEGRTACSASEGRRRTRCPGDLTGSPRPRKREYNITDWEWLRLKDVENSGS